MVDLEAQQEVDFGTFGGLFWAHIVAKFRAIWSGIALLKGGRKLTLLCKGHFWPFLVTMVNFGPFWVIFGLFWGSILKAYNITKGPKSGLILWIRRWNLFGGHFGGPFGRVLQIIR